MSDSEGKEGSSGSSPNSRPDPAQAPPAADERKSKRKTLKRALKGTVGAGLTAASAALLARSNEIGEWLYSVAPHVLPHTGAGADIAGAGADMVLRAIAEAKSCIEEGANVCLDAEGKVTALYTFISQWYLSPRQHVVETAASILVLSPLVYLYFKLCRSRLRLKRAASAFDFKRPNLLMKVWGACLLGLVSAGAFLKFTKQGIISHPAYLWQPCHVHSLVMGLCAFVETEGSLLMMHVATTLWWGPFLAFVAPSLPIDPIEWGSFPVASVSLERGAYPVATGPSTVNLVTGVNVATMSVPPDSLEMFGKYYRPVWGVICGLLQLAAVGVMCALAGLFGQWPQTSLSPESSSRTCGKVPGGTNVAAKGATSRGIDGSSATPAKAGSGSTSAATGGGVPADAVAISQEKAVSLVDGK
eukprot:g13650.t1